MNRIDPAKVAEFFKTNPRIVPVQRRFVVTENDKIFGCCGLSSVVLRRKPDDVSVLDVSLNTLGTNASVDRIAKVLELPSEYALGFVNGWDNHNAYPNGDRSYNRGIKAGLKAYTLTVEALR